ncbi:hypothetical protein [Alicyclobacillus fastidiosus]|uniref:5-bromo-4-chloroindolyl phosphate hydrolysis protein n=1 Tax=Alicyclobacillus fastidiosus TaxID=392011 RepID=A0ABV5AJN5_9BACL|nr:hypothetical protein [Alicyclobacillus fastidiosus]WEH11131.1 hypothetical protein PYS47_07905 [Alicyclobacillus fastidiosus]
MINRVNKFLLYVSVSASVLALIFFFYMTLDVWRLSDASIGFIGAIIGGFISGVLTVGGVVLTLNKQDNDRKREEDRKFLENYPQKFLYTTRIQRRIGHLINISLYERQKRWSALVRSKDEVAAITEEIIRVIGGRYAIVADRKALSFSSIEAINETKIARLANTGKADEYFEELDKQIEHFTEIINGLEMIVSTYKGNLTDMHTEISAKFN